MTKLPALTGKGLIKAPRKAGFEVVRVKGSHHFRSFLQPSPNYPELYAGTLS